MASQKSFFTWGTGAEAGDVLVITKPLGTGLIEILKDFWENDEKKRYRMTLLAKESGVGQTFDFGDFVINKVNNRKAVLAMVGKYNVHAVAEISSAGILGHAEMLVKEQKMEVDFLIQNLPVMKYMDCFSYAFEHEPGFRLTEGRSPEAPEAGGLLIALPREDGVLFCKEIQRMTQFPAWIVGSVNYGTRTATVIKRPYILEVFRNTGKDSDQSE